MTKIIPVLNVVPIVSIPSDIVMQFVSGIAKGSPLLSYNRIDLASGEVEIPIVAPTGKVIVIEKVMLPVVSPDGAVDITLQFINKFDGNKYKITLAGATGNLSITRLVAFDRLTITVKNRDNENEASVVIAFVGAVVDYQMYMKIYKAFLKYVDWVVSNVIQGYLGYEVKDNA